MVLLIVFFDRLAPTTLQVGGLLPSVLGALVASVLGFAFLFEAPALLGLRTRRTLPELATRTFGQHGARLVPDVVLGLAQVVWFAVTIHYAVDLSLRSLVAARLLDSGVLDTARVGAIQVPGLAFQATVLLWILPAVILGPILVHLVAAVLYAYAVFPAIVFGVLMIWFLRGLPGYQPPPADPRASWQAFAMMIQLVFGYLATAGLGGADWGAMSRARRDVHLGGMVGVALAPTVVVSVALVTVAGFLGRHPAAAATYSAALLQGIGGWPGAALMMTFTFALLGPTCYMPTGFCRLFAAAWPGPRRWVWPLVGAGLAWPLVASGRAGHLETIFGLLGAAVAPIAGALAADWLRDRGGWPGPRRGFNPAGLLAWLVGCAVGLIPYLGPMLGAARLARVQPAAVLAFLAAFVIQGALGLFRVESPTVTDSSSGLPPYQGGIEGGSGLNASRTQEEPPPTPPW